MPTEIEFDSERLRSDLITKRVIERKINIRVASDEIGISPATLSRAENCCQIDTRTFAQILGWLKTDPARYFKNLLPKCEHLNTVGLTQISSKCLDCNAEILD